MTAALAVKHILSVFSQQLDDKSCPETTGMWELHALWYSSSDLQQCGDATFRLLQNIVNDVGHAEARRRPFIARVETQLDTLLALANDHINAVHFRDVRPCWLRLYTDASILRSGIDLLHHETIASRSQWLAVARRLDMATIIGGGTGMHRADWIATLLRQVDRIGLATTSPTCSSSSRPPPSKRVKRDVYGNDPLLCLSAYAAQAVPRTSAPSMVEYASRLSSSPFIVSKFANDPESETPPWPALNRWCDAHYLLDSVGEGRVVPVEVGRAYSDTGWGQEIMHLRDFLHGVGYDVEPESAPRSTSTPPLYLAQHSLFRQFPQLEKDFSIPEYVWSRPQPDSSQAYEPIAESALPIVNVWVGNSDDHPVSPAHTDPHFNCYVQVLGRKRIWLAPPSAGVNMYAFDTAEVDEEEDETGINRYMVNTSRVPIFQSEDDQRTRTRFPLFFDHVAPIAMEAVLNPGDLLVMPPGWWHAMKGEGQGPGWSISMWY